MDRTYYGAQVEDTPRPVEKGWPHPTWNPTPKKKDKRGSGLYKRFFDVRSDGTHGERKRGWGPV
jgi:hypothetical protein